MIDYVIDGIERSVCIDCDELERNCTCDNIYRCSCGIPILVCFCAYGPEADAVDEDEGIIS